MFVLFLSTTFLFAAPTTGLVFSGAANSFIDVGVQNAFVTNQFTIEAWVNYDNVNGGYIISNEGWDGTNQAQGFSLRAVGSKFDFTVGSTANWHSVQSTIDIPIGTWVHLAATYTDTQMKLYINGVEDASRTITTPMVLSNFNVTIGEGSMWKDRRFVGKMGDLRFWNVVRTPTEISNSFNSYLAGTEDGLVANWKMLEGTGENVSDAKGSYNLTKTADVAWFGAVSSVGNQLTDKIETVIVGKTLKVINNSQADVQVIVNNIIGQKVSEFSVRNESTSEVNLDNFRGTMILNFNSNLGKIKPVKFIL